MPPPPRESADKQVKFGTSRMFYIPEPMYRDQVSVAEAALAAGHQCGQM